MYSNIRLDSLTGEIIVEVPNNDEVETIESLIQAVGKIEVIDYSGNKKVLTKRPKKNETITPNDITAVCLAVTVNSYGL